jgi:hypothetical protein
MEAHIIRIQESVMMRVGKPLLGIKAIAIHPPAKENEMEK